MPIEQRVVSQGRPTGITSKGREQAAKQPEVPEATDKQSNKLLKALIVLLVLMLLGGAGTTLYLIKSRDPGPEPEPEKVAGEIHAVESINVNLSDSHYLRLGFAVQLSTDAEPIDNARVLDVAIGLYSGQPFDKVLDPDHRETLRAELTQDLNEIFDGEVMDVYFTDYVAQ
ncbi:flagellar basal body-associated FliL family protein [Timonella senegalensis]|uniref:flagellar basal body-associated FliL family protein n=1 Tax=Timonella senegalensis TaxID=1465825 RepID=UPI0028AC84F2|nr:flagellar basal body-associated FliL family protein [Timonella senegalensis]